MLSSSLTRFASVSTCPPRRAPHRPHHSVRLSFSSSGGTRITATSDAEPASGRAAALQAAPRRTYRPQRTPSSAAEDAAVQGYLQGTLAIDAAAARALTVRCRCPALLQLSDCEDWVTYLLRLASGDSAAASAILRLHPSLLDRACDQPRLDQLQQYLSTALGITQPQLLSMAKRSPRLLYTSLPTIAAAAEYLAQLGGDSAAAQKAVLDHPALLSARVAALRSGLQCLTEQLGVLPANALNKLPNIVSIPIAARLESRGQWLQQLGFTPAQVLRLAVVHPPLFSTSTHILQRRLTALTQTFGIAAEDVQRMFAAQPGVWLINYEGQLAQLKLLFWQQELGYSRSQLTLAPIFLISSLVRVASRVATLQGLLGARLTPQRLVAALINPRRGTSKDSFGPRFFSAHVKQYGSTGASVQALLQPLSARLSQAELRVEWAAALEAHPLLVCGAPSSPPHRQLYAALDDIAERDWALSAHGVKWTAAEAEAKAAGRADKALKRAATAAVKAAAPKAPRGRPRGSGKAGGGNTADAAQAVAAGATRKQLKAREGGATASASAADTAATPVAVNSAASTAAASAGTAASSAPASTAASVSWSSATQPSPAPVPPPAGIAAGSSPPTTPGSAPVTPLAPVTLTAQAAPRRRLARDQGDARQAAPSDRQPLHAAAAGAAGQQQAGGMAGGTRRKSAGKAKGPPAVPPL